MSYSEWFDEYTRTLYLRTLDDTQLQARFDHIANNLWSTGPRGEVTPPRSPEVRQRLLRLIVHAVAERVRRSRADISICENSIREEASRNYTPPRLRPQFTGSPNCFAKFGNLVHLRNTYSRGALRIRLASTYSDPSLNAAQRDDELMHLSRTPNRQLPMRLIGLDDNGNEVELPYSPQEYFEGITSNDFYVWCCSAAYDGRIISDFSYDSVLVIRDKEAFRSRFRAEMARHLPSQTMADGQVQYYDPYDIDPSLLRPIFVKDFRYLYQNEYRFAWEAGSGSHPEYIDIELGPLADISELLETEI